MNQFETLGLAEPILRAIAGEGYTTPTPIQAKVIPLMTDGRDLVGIAQTGTGKTAAFVLPILNRLAAGYTPLAAKTCRALIVVPTRELAGQVADAIKVYGKHMRLTVVTITGGVKPVPQIRAMHRGADIIVATPGRLLDLMRSKAVLLNETRTVVLDEADQMLDLGFFPAIRTIMSKLPKSRQTALLSATMPKQIRALAEEFLNDPAEVSVATNSKPIERIAQRMMRVDAAQKRAVLTDILKGDGVERAIVFTRTKRGADKVNTHLQGAGLSTAAIHGNKSQNQRERSLADFRTGRVSVLVATDIAARGIDIDGVSHVVNFELPNVAEAYVHRIGRTARAGKSGIAVSLCDPTETSLLRDIEKLIRCRFGADGMPVAMAPGEKPQGGDGPKPGARPGSRARRRGNSQGNGGAQGKSGGYGAGAPRGGNRPRRAGGREAARA